MRSGFAEKFRGLFATNHTNTAKAIESRLGDMARSCVLASYGFSQNRAPASKAADVFNKQHAGGSQVALHTIDAYNGCVGIRWEGTGFRELVNLDDDINNGNLQVSIPSDTDENGKRVDLAGIDSQMHSIGAERAGKWRDFVHQNAAKIDILGKLHGYITSNDPVAKKTGWAAEFARNKDRALKQFVDKNIPVKCVTTAGDVDRLAALLKEFVLSVSAAPDKNAAMEDFYNKHFRPGDTGYCQTDIDRNVHNSDTDNIEDLFNGVLLMATFRQTSKLGIDFFRKEKVPVMFQWSNHEKVSGMQERHNHWWKKNPARFGDNVRGNAITLSETRHMDRLYRSLHMTEVRDIQDQRNKFCAMLIGGAGK